MELMSLMRLFHYKHHGSKGNTLVYGRGAVFTENFGRKEYTGTTGYTTQNLRDIWKKFTTSYMLVGIK